MIALSLAFVAGAAALSLNVDKERPVTKVINPLKVMQSTLESEAD